MDVLESHEPVSGSRLLGADSLDSTVQLVQQWVIPTAEEAVAATGTKGAEECQDISWLLARLCQVVSNPGWALEQLALLHDRGRHQYECTCFAVANRLEALGAEPQSQTTTSVSLCHYHCSRGSRICSHMNALVIAMTLNMIQKRFVLQDMVSMLTSLSLCHLK